MNGNGKEKDGGYLKQFIGQKMKVVVQEPLDDRPKAFEATIKGIEEGMLVVDSDAGGGAYRIDYVIAIKPRNK